MRLSINDGCDFQSKSEKATDALLALLIEHHDYSVPFQHVPKPQVIEIKAEPEVSVPIEVGILPVPEGVLTIEAIKRVACKHFNVSHTDMVSARREQKFVKPRMVAMYLSKKLTPRSLPEIGRRFGGRDHTTVLHAVRKIEWLVRINDPITVDVECLREVLEA